MCKFQYNVYLRSTDAIVIDKTKGRYGFNLTSTGGGTDLSQYQGIAYCQIKVCNFATDYDASGKELLLIKSTAPLPNSLQSSRLLPQTGGSTNSNFMPSNILAVIQTTAKNSYTHFDMPSVLCMNIFRGNLTIEITDQSHTPIDFDDKEWQLYLCATFDEDQLDKTNDAVLKTKLKPFSL